MRLDVIFTGNGWDAMFDDRRWPTAVGRGGVGTDKREGDGVTPVGEWPLRRVFFRSDRVSAPRTVLPCHAIAREDGWCDDPGDPAYNTLVRLPNPARHETLFREDHLYDVLVVLGYNDDPPVSGLGSAIFLHLARPDFSPTEGCVALELEALRTVLEKGCTHVRVHPAE